MALNKATPLVISAQVRNRFILGRQSLWPGRRGHYKSTPPLSWHPAKIVSCESGYYPKLG